MPVSVDFKKIGPFKDGFEITENKDALMQFSVNPVSDAPIWEHTIPPFGGFVLVGTGAAEK